MKAFLLVLFLALFHFNAKSMDPDAVCMDITVNLNASGQTSLSVASIDGGSTVPSGFNTSISVSDVDCSDVGTPVVVRLSISEGNIEVSSCTSNVTVVDDLDPQAICQDITVQLDNNSQASIAASDVDGGSTDNCAVGMTTLSTNQFDCSNIGSNSVELTVNDVNGNVSTCSSVVSIVDNIPPNVPCQNNTAVLGANGSVAITDALIDAGSSDNCAVATRVVSPNSFECMDLGLNTVVLTVTDINGNVGTCASQVDVIDNISPSLTCLNNLDVFLDPNGQATVEPVDVIQSQSDNCALTPIVGQNLNLDCTDLISINNYDLTVSDVAGNTSNCMTSINLIDNVPPSATCQDITVQLDNNGEAIISVNDVDGGSTDNCAVGMTTVSMNQFDCSHIGSNSVELTVNDVNGNVSTCSSVVSIVDNIPPNVPCQNNTVVLGANGSVAITDDLIDAGSSDNCAVATRVVSPNSFECMDLGFNTVVLTVTDINGNAGTCASQVDVIDNISPSLTCLNNLDVFLDPNGQATVEPMDVIQSQSDNCALTPIVGQNLNLQCVDLISVNNYDLTVSDVAGNTSTCMTSINLIENLPPTAACQDITVQLDNNGEAIISVNDVDGGSTDNCAVGMTTVSMNQFDCSHIGSNSVELTVNDVNGNVSTCSSDITVVDDLPPIAICQDISLNVPNSGTISVDPSEIDGGSNDNCAMQSLSVPNNSFSCSNIGSNILTLTALDINGNLNTCQSNVSIFCPALPVEFGPIRLEEQNEGIAITWTTLSEVDNDKFIIERSIDGEIFTPIGSINGAGYSDIPLEYKYLDRSPTLGNNFYRIKQVDYNGRFSYSRILSIQNKSSARLRVWPNPSADVINFELSSKTSVDFQIINLRNRVVKSGKASSTGVHVLPAGLYYLAIKLDNEVLIEPIVVRKPY